MCVCVRAHVCVCVCVCVYYLLCAGLARFTCASSWLSQWSVHDSNADGVHHMQNIHVPVLVIENGADNGCPQPHPTDMFQACAATDKTFHVIRHARHYYDGQPGKLQEACQYVLEWLRVRSLVDISLVSATAAADGTGVADAADELVQLRGTYDGSSAMEIKGINHLALVSSDMKRTCEFYGGGCARVPVPCAGVIRHEAHMRVLRRWVCTCACTRACVHMSLRVCVCLFAQAYVVRACACVCMTMLLVAECTRCSWPSPVQDHLLA